MDRNESPKAPLLAAGGRRREFGSYGVRAMLNSERMWTTVYGFQVPMV